MVNPRRFVQQGHERFHVQLLVAALNHRHHSTYRVIAEPNPPEAIIQSKGRTSWVEVVSAFWNDAYARDLYSYATPGEKYRAMREGPFIDMTAEFAENFASAVAKKLEKATYERLRDRFGPGYLVVPILFPFLGTDSLPYMRVAFKARNADDRGCFRSIYLNLPGVEHPMLSSAGAQRARPNPSVKASPNSCARKARLGQIYHRPCRALRAPL